jgi:hypothetical protein
MFTGHILNCFLSGEVWTGNDETGAGALNRIPLRIGGTDAELIQGPAFLLGSVSEFEGKQVHTTDLVVPAATPADLPTCLSLLSGIVELLMFATVSEVRRGGYLMPGADPFERSDAVVGVTLHGIPVLELADGANTKRYLESVWPKYVLLRNARRLDIAFEYFVLSQKGGQPLEVKAAITFILLEHLKHTYARSVGYPFENGWNWRRRNAAGKPEGRLGFKILLSEMFGAVGMTPSLEAAVDLRNELVHSGMTALSFDALHVLLSECQDLAREYLLRLLAYTGPYIPFSEPNSERILETSAAAEKTPLP